MTTKFKKGDVVVCVDNEGYEDILTIGKEYTVRECMKFYSLVGVGYYCDITDDKSCFVVWSSKLELKSRRKPTLLEVINFMYPELDLKEDEPFIIKGVNNKFKIKNNEFWQLINGDWKEIKSKHINNIYKKGIEKIEKKYYLKAKDWRVITPYEQPIYLNLDLCHKSVCWSNNSHSRYYQVQFTLKEIEELKKISDIAKARVEFCELVEFVEVENEN